LNKYDVKELFGLALRLVIKHLTKDDRKKFCIIKLNKDDKTKLFSLVLRLPIKYLNKAERKEWFGLVNYLAMGRPATQ
jgi:hypothetical protein